MKKAWVYSVLIFLASLVTGCAREKDVKIDCFKLYESGAMYKRHIPKSDLSIPPGLYHFNMNGERSIQVDFPSPKEKPVIQWKYQTKFTDPNRMIVDSKGGTWLYEDIFPVSNDNSSSENKVLVNLVNFNPDGTEAWQKNVCTREIFRSYCTFKFVAICDNAVISMIESIPNDPRGDVLPNDVCLECRDLNGDSIWITSPEKLDLRAWRISKNRLMVHFLGKPSGKFALYSLSDGSLVKTIQFPEWPFDEESLEKRFITPIELPDGGWIGFKGSFLMRYDKNIKPIWAYNFKDYGLNSQPLLAEDLVLFSPEDGGEKQQDSIKAIDVNNGKESWKLDSREPIKLSSPVEFCGTKSRGDILLRGYVYTPSGSTFNGIEDYYEKNQIHMISNNGEKIWSVDSVSPENSFFEGPNINTIVYNDGCVLFSGMSYLRLVDIEGTVLWSLSLAELGFQPEPDPQSPTYISLGSSGEKIPIQPRSKRNKPHGPYNIIGNLFPAPDGRIVFCVQHKPTNNEEGLYIISLSKKIQS